MNTKTIMTLVMALALVAVAWKLSSQRAPQTEVTRTAFVPDLIERTNDVTRLELKSAKHATSLVRKGEAWTVANRDDFPAKAADIKRTILQVAAFETVEAKTSQRENYARIGVADLDQGGEGTQIEAFAGDAQEPLFALIVGNSRDAGRQEQRYLRRHGDTQSWLVNGAFDATADPITWLDARIADIDTTRVARVEVTPRAGAAVIVNKADQKDNFFTLENVPQGFEPKSKALVSSMGALLLDLRFNDVAAAAKYAQVEVARRTRVQTFDGLVATIEEFTADGKSFARFAFAYDPALLKTPAPPAPAAATDAGAPAAEPAADTVSPASAEPAAPGSEVTPATDAAATPKETVADEAQRLSLHTAAWVYELPDYKVRMLSRPLADLIKKKEADPPSK